MKTVIFSHPWDKSFNKSILDNIIQKYEKENIQYNLIDLYRDNFNPVMTAEDLELFSKGEYNDSLVGKYQEFIKQSDELVFIFPIWWSLMPAMMKGFLDKVFLKGFAYKDTEFGIKGLLENVKSAKVITTATSPKLFMIILGSINWLFNFGIAKSVGIKKFKWLHISLKIENTDEKRKNSLEKVKNFIVK